MRTFVIREPVFKTEPLFIYNCTHIELQEYLKKRFKINDEWDDAMGSTHRYNQPPWRIVWIRNWDGKKEAHGVLVHELFHMVLRICEDKGVPVIPNIQTGACGDETAAYLLEYFYVQAIKSLKV